jgi:proteasome lid subunit RPN8/RPN11
MEIGDSADLGTAKSQMLKPSSKVKFASDERHSPGAASRDASGHRVTFVDGLPEPRSQEFSKSQLDAPPPERPLAEMVPEVSYDLDSGATVTATMCGRVCRALVEHCGESNIHGREVGGVLVGHRSEREDDDHRKQYSLSITDLIPIRSFDSSDAHISITEDEWTRAECELGQKYTPEGKCRLGWYHTHPIQGIFFSKQDHRAHDIFVQAYQFALVVDPRNMEAGLFYWSSYEERILAGPVRFALRRFGK